ncbi:HNH endonuclease [Saccharopolyspora elongata]|uniref:HNH endonuclease n=1 Tax=Saccharopolyspora elongata TaxID=2530387 RepID=A0A4R4YRP0_9PSEU|nr:HNH endonuclease [Saccharopolyspora elongata]
MIPCQQHHPPDAARTAAPSSPPPADKPWQQRSRHQPRGRLARRDVAFKAEHLRLEPNCRGCGRPAEQVDHILPLAKGGAMFDHANAQSLCGPCHNVKTRSENAARNRSRSRRSGG